MRASFKIVVFGDGAVGKTALRSRYMGRGFKTSYLGTIGCDFASTKVNINRKEHIIQIWDLAGQPGQKNVRRMFYHGTNGGIAVFDVTRHDSFESLPGWLSECFKHSGHGSIPVVILGNKVDLRDQVSDCVQPELGQEYAEKLGQDLSIPVFYFDTSAKTGLNVNEAFDWLGRKMLEWKKKRKFEIKT
ncbi:MAG: GTP-binding protein [Candidatus Hodarchaeota archaeon]